MEEASSPAEEHTVVLLSKVHTVCTVEVTTRLVYSFKCFRTGVAHLDSQQMRAKRTVTYDTQKWKEKKDERKRF